MGAFVSILEGILCFGKLEVLTVRIPAAGAKIINFGGNLFDPNGYEDIPAPQSACHGQAVALAIGIAVAIGLCCVLVIYKYYRQAFPKQQKIIVQMPDRTY